jgi:hypothetical protein
LLMKEWGRWLSLVREESGVGEKLISNLIYKFTTSVRASVCLTRQFCILIHRQNRPNIW